MSCIWTDPFAGSRMLRDLLRGEGIAIGRELAATMMRRMGIEALVPPAENVETGRRAQDLSVSAAQPGGGVAEPGVGNGHHLHPDGPRLCLSGCGGGLVQPAGPGLAAIDHSGSRVLPGRGRGGAGQIRATEDLQYRSGQSVHQHRIHRPAIGERDRDQHGWPRFMARQCLSSSGCGGRSNTRRSTCGPTTVSVKHALRSAGTCISTIAERPHSSLLPERRIMPTSITCRCSKQHEFRRRCRGITPVKLRPPGVTPRQRHTTTSTGQRLHLCEGETLSRRSQPPLCIPESLVKIYAFVVLLVLPLVYFLWLTATNSLADFLMRSWAGRPRHVYRYDAQLFRIHMKAKEDLRKFRSDTRRIIVEHELKLYKVRWQRYTTRVKRSWVRLRDLLWGR